MNKAPLTVKFKRWWKGINKHPPHRQQEILEKWLKYACKTVALRGDQDEQQVVYATYNRYTNSQFKKLKRWQAHSVFRIVNQRMENYKRQRQQTGEWQPKPPNPGPTVVVKRRRIISSGKQAGRVSLGK